MNKFLVTDEKGWESLVYSWKEYVDWGLPDKPPTEYPVVVVWRIETDSHSRLQYEFVYLNDFQS